MILVLPDLEILQDQSLLRNRLLKTEEEKGQNIRDPTHDLKRNLSKEIQTASKIPVTISGQNLKKSHTSRTRVRAMRKNLSENLREAEKISIQEISMKEAALNTEEDLLAEMKETTEQNLLYRKEG